MSVHPFCADAVSAQAAADEGLRRDGALSQRDRRCRREADSVLELGTRADAAEDPAGKVALDAGALGAAG